MQKRLNEELQILDINIKVIQESYFAIDFILNKLLSAPDKSFEVTFKGVEYDFIYPTTQDEKQSMMILRRNLLRELFKEVFVQMVDGQNPWDMIKVFASGIDTLDMQIEIIKEDVVNRVDENDEKITALPLDMDNYQIEMQKPEVEFNELDTEDQEMDSN